MSNLQKEATVGFTVDMKRVGQESHQEQNDRISRNVLGAGAELEKWLKERDPSAKISFLSEKPVLPQVEILASEQALKELQNPSKRPAIVDMVVIAGPDDEKLESIFTPQISSKGKIQELLDQGTSRREGGMPDRP